MNDTFLKSLEIMWKGMFSIFVVIIIIMLLVMLLTKIFGVRSTSNKTAE